MGRPSAWVWVLVALTTPILGLLTAPLYCSAGCTISPPPTPSWVHGVVNLLVLVAVLRPLRLLVLLGLALIVLADSFHVERELLLIAMGLYAPGATGLVVVIAASRSARLLINYFNVLSLVYSIMLVAGLVAGAAIAIKTIARRRGVYKSWGRSLLGAIGVLLASGFTRLLVEGVLSRLNIVIYRCGCPLREGLIHGLLINESISGAWVAVSLASLIASFLYALVLLILLDIVTQG